MAYGYSVVAGASLVAATAKTALNLIAGATTQPKITEIGVSFNGTSSTAIPVLVELCTSTQGSAGTSTAFTPLQIRNWPPAPAICTAGINYTAEPTTLVVTRHWYVSPTSGIVLQFPLGREIEGIITVATAGKGWALRLTAPAAVDYKVYFEFDE